MIGRTVFAAVAALVLGAGFMMTPAAEGKGGPKCGKLCKGAIAAAKATCPAEPKKDRRACLKAARRETLAACKAQPTPREQCLPASPSGAFLD